MAPVPQLIGFYGPLSGLLLYTNVEKQGRRCRRNHLLTQGPSSIKTLARELGGFPGKAGVNCHLAFHLGSIVGVCL